MAKIFIDTNVFLNLYMSSKEGDIQTICNEIKKHHSHLVFPTHVLDEYKRRRQGKLNELKNNLPSISNIIDFGIIKDIDIISELKTKRKEFIKTRHEVEEKIDSLICNCDEDLIYQLVVGIVSSSEATIIDTATHDMFNKAHQRFLLGNPPGTSSKTICDELIWEALLTFNDDLVIVSYDNKAYADNFIFLRDEYKNATGRMLYSVEKSITKALNRISVIPSEAAVLSEEKIRGVVKPTRIYDRSIVLHDDNGEIISDYKGSFLVDNGKTYIFCPYCLTYTQHSGVMCVNCGYRHED